MIVCLFVCFSPQEEKRAIRFKYYSRHTAADCNIYDVSYIDDLLFTPFSAILVISGRWEEDSEITPRPLDQ